MHRTANSAKRTYLEVPGSSKAKRGLFNDAKSKMQSPFAQPTPVVKKKKTAIVKAVVSSLIPSLNRRQVYIYFN